MARLQKDNADYFSHDNDMRNDEKIKAVRRKFKHEGYSIWNMLLEKLCKSSGFVLDYSVENVELWSGDFEVDPEKLSEIIEYFLLIKLLLKHDGMIFSETMIDRFSPLLDKRKRKRESYEQAKLVSDIVSDVRNTHSIVKDSIVKNSKEEKEEEVLLMNSIKIENCKLKPETRGYKVIETAIEIYTGFRKAYPANKDLPLVTAKEWITPLRSLIEKKEWPPERVIELAKWAVKHEFWKKRVHDTAALERSFEKIKADYQDERAKKTA